MQTKEDIARYLKLIQHSHLFFETDDKLSFFFNRPHLRNKKCKDSLGRITRSNRSLISDYDRFDQLAVSLSNESFLHESSYSSEMKLSSFLDLYERLSESEDFRTPSNSRDNSRYGKLYYNSRNNLTPEGLAGIINGFLDGDKRYSSLYKYFGLHEDEPESIINNYRLTLGILLLMRCIPFCLASTKFRGSRPRLISDKDKALNFCEILVSSNTNANTNILEFVKLSFLTNRSLCRFSIIISVMQLINQYAVSVKPKLLQYYTIPDSEKLIRHLPFSGRYWKEKGSSESSTYYIVENPESSSNISLVLYQCKQIGRTIYKERFDISLYKNGRTCISRIDSIYNYLTENHLIEMTGTFSISENSINIIPTDMECKWFKTIELVPTISPPPAEFCSKVIDEEKSVTNMKSIAALNFIAPDCIILDSSKEGYILKANENNGLKNILPHLTVCSDVRLIELGDRRFIVCLGDPVFYRIEVTTEEQCLVAGLNKLTK